ncbi:MAG: type II toxin-antitoxin system VapB family antitoxin [Phenylobacterium sp.]|uniref:type II toxin-antitoxin system VapB family antitoxin n=1 Tax=Phenylobacterium sp. TaxID=1871053 RepID=UPI001A51F331|nr:type II toxin-antitoxin system VapB family antitoxin [Phenylobacterium sp.]MBL8552771.1 type II toxin-antitoxin system VapB family antitoxin [Phenylobacterium sp.]
MAILIKNPEVERKARELASRHGLSITAVIDGALDRALAEAQPKPRPTAADILAATARMRAEAGIRHPLPPVTKAEWDEINEVPGFAEGED